MAHPSLVPVAMEVFDASMPRANQIIDQRQMPQISAASLLAPHNDVSEAGIRTNMSVVIEYTAAWLRGRGAVPIHNLMEGAATAEISRSQLWQWLRHGAFYKRADMAAYDADSSKFTQSLGCWSGFHAQQKIKAVKRMKGTAKGTYIYLSGWMVAGLRNSFGHLPDQSMHEKTAVADLIREIYVSLRQADEVALNDLFNELRDVKEVGGD